jgi:hypothetical protein
MFIFGSQHFCGAGVETRYSSGSDDSGSILDVQHRLFIKIVTNCNSFLFTFNFNNKKSAEKIAPTLLTFVRFKKVGLVYSRVGAKVTEAGAASKFSLGAAEK